MASIDKLATPTELRGRKWWESKLMITFLALIVPLTAVIKDYIQMQREAARAQQHQEQEIQMQYLNLVTRTDLGLRNRATVLRFLASIAVQHQAREWARKEIADTAAEEQSSAKALADNIQREQGYLREIAHLRDSLKKAQNDSQRTHAATDQLGKLISLTELNRAEIARLRKHLDHPARPSPDHYRCLPETMLALGGSGPGDARQTRCQASLAADGSPPDGFLDVNGLSYTWVSGGLTCHCIVSVSFTD